MNTQRTRRPWLPAAMAATLLLMQAGCMTTTPMQFYTLNATAAAPAVADNALVLAVGPIDLPEYLQRPQIVTRLDSNRLKVDEFHRWGGALEEEISRVLSRDLGALLGTQRVYSYPSRVVPDTQLRVAVNIRSFDGDLGGEAVLDAAWSLFDDRDNRLLDTRQAVYRMPVEGADYAAYAAALSDGLAQLSRDIAAVIAARADRAARP